MRFATLIGMVVLAGCAGTTPVALPGAMGRGAEHAQRGTQLYERGDYARAADEFSKSLAAERSAENEGGIATASLNLALALQRLERRAAAEQVIDGVLLDTVLAYPPGILAELATKKAQFRVGAADFAAAQFWVDKAGAFCGSPCRQSMRLHTLSARIALERGDPVAALAELDAARGSDPADDAETANRLRLRAAANLQMGKAASALSTLEEVLRIDKAAGDSRKILQDLRLLAACHAALGQSDQERRYWQRALSVAVGLGDETDAAEIRDRLAQLQRQ